MEFWESLGKVKNEAADSSDICHCLPVRPYELYVLFKNL